MTNTGLALRNRQELGSEYSKQAAQGARDVELASRDEYGRGVQGMEGLMGNLANMTALYKQSKDKSFWETFKGSLASSLGSLPASMVTAGAGNVTYSKGKGWGLSPKGSN
jgi:hypothetical protein